MTDPRKQWDSQLEEGFPDSRLSWASREEKMVKVGHLDYERIYCANCGCAGGAVTPQFFAHAFYICDPCIAKLGKPVGLFEIKQEDYAATGIAST